MCTLCFQKKFPPLNSEILTDLQNFCTVGKRFKFVTKPIRRHPPYLMHAFVANFICFPAVQKFWKSVNIWQSYSEFKGGNFFWDTVYIIVYVLPYFTEYYSIVCYLFTVWRTYMLCSKVTWLTGSNHTLSSGITCGYCTYGRYQEK